MEQMSKVQAFFLGFLGLAVIGVVVIIVLTSFDNSTQFNPDYNGMENFTYVSAYTLNPLGEGITSSSFSRINDTWVSCDGNNDYLQITPSSNDTISFWYNSSTSVGWRFVVNVQGTNYTDGVQVNPDEYPVYWDGTDYYFCKTDASTFWEGDIDSIGIYDGQLNTNTIGEIFANGRN